MEFAVVKAGHDQGQIYLIASGEGEFVNLVNGSTRPYEKVKKKNKKHIQIIKHIPQEIAEVMEEAVPKNQRVRKAVKLLSAHMNNQNPNNNDD